MKHSALAGALAAILLTPAAVPAQDARSDRFDFGDLSQQVDALIAACTQDRNGIDCRRWGLVVVPNAVRAISFLGHSGDRAGSIETLRRLASSPLPEVRAAVAYAIANLGPEPDDLPLLTELLQERIPGVQRAALGALAKLADPRAVSLVKRARGANQFGARNFSAEPLPFNPDDPAALGLADWPSDPQFLFFENSSGYVFTTAASIEETVAQFEAVAGQKAVALEAMAGPDASAQGVMEFKERAYPGTLVIPLTAPEPAGTRRLAIVYADPHLGRTGFALFYGAGERRPEAPTPAPEPESPPLPAGASETAGDWPAPPEPEIPPGVTPEEAAAFLEVLRAEGRGIEAFLAAFPTGGFRARAEAIANAPRIDTDRDIYSDLGDVITLTWVNMPPGGPHSLYLARPDAESVSAGWVLGAIDGASGSIELTLDDRIIPDMLDLRVVSNGRILTQRTIQTLSYGELTVPDAPVQPGAPVEIGFKNFPAGYPENRIAIVPYPSALDVYPSAEVKTGDATEGRVTLTAPTAPGEYEVRAIWHANFEPSVFAFLTVAAPEGQAGQPEARASVSLNKTVFAPGEEIVITFADMLGHARDYMSTAPAGSVPSRYLNYVYTQGATAGTVTLRAPSEPGAYEVRAFYKDETDTVRATVAFTVAAP